MHAAVEPAVLRAAATAELQRCLAARAQVAALGRWAEREGVPLVVLKGGRAAAAGDVRVGMQDLDVLVPLEAAGGLAAFLHEGLGFSLPAGADSELPGHHLRQRVAPGALQVEVHRFLKELPETAALLERSVPLPVRGVRGLAPGDHLLHLLLHTAASHPERRGRLRELILLAGAWNGCSPAEGAHTLATASAREDAPVLSALLGMARSLAERRFPADAFAAEAAARVLLRTAYERARLPRRLARAVSDAAFALLGGAPERRSYWSRGVGGGPLPARAWRAGRITMGMALAAPVAAAARRAVRDS